MRFLCGVVVVCRCVAGGLFLSANGEAGVMSNQENLLSHALWQVIHTKDMNVFKDNAAIIIEALLHEGDFAPVGAKIDIVDAVQHLAKFVMTKAGYDVTDPKTIAAWDTLISRLAGKGSNADSRSGNDTEADGKVSTSLTDETSHVKQIVAMLMKDNKIDTLVLRQKAWVELCAEVEKIRKRLREGG
jgi:hypothetical protein